jgi:DNA helicase-2/ATP-dependent DNA helicase PcrA
MASEYHDEVDAAADATIRACIDMDAPTSFFLYAGAGSGKTRALVNAVRHALTRSRQRLSLEARQIGVITYTNAACDEIKERLDFDQLLHVSTIHSFAWLLISGFNADIRVWLTTNLATEIAELEGLQARGRVGTKAAGDRQRSIEAKQSRLAALSQIRKFVYSPTGDNRTRDSLNHAEVITMAAHFLSTKPRLRDLLVSRFPILLVDESQDTSRGLMDALLSTQASNGNRFCLGLFGDTMQRIYFDGKERLAEAIPSDWARPAKRVNHRSPSRIVQLINRIRLDDDRQQQVWRPDKEGGIVRLFPLSKGTLDRSAAEAAVANEMVTATGDSGWAGGSSQIKALILEHHMAAKRLGFEDLFRPLYAVENYRTGLLDGSLPGIAFFCGTILPLVERIRMGDEFGVANIVKRDSPLLSKRVLSAAGNSQFEQIATAKAAVERFSQILAGDVVPTLLEVLQNVAASGLLQPPESLVPFALPSAGPDYGTEEDSPALLAWRQALAVPLGQMVALNRYLTGNSPFGTHQGVKGLEFPRVMVVVDDEEARGFSFSYEKLLGVKEKSKTDMENEAAGKETSIERTRRLLYVTCSRAERSLAVVCYSENPVAVADYARRREWFESEEIVFLQ